MQRLIKSTITIIFIFIIIIFYLSLGKENNYDTVNLVGKQIDSIELQSFNDEKIVNTKSFKDNNFTLINFWASWCGPCRAEHPILMNLKESRSLMLVGVNFKDKKKNAKNFLDDLGNPYDILLKDENGKKSIIFGIYGIPESILLNKELVIIGKFVGPLVKEDYEKILEEIGEK